MTEKDLGDKYQGDVEDLQLWHFVRPPSPDRAQIGDAHGQETPVKS